MFRLAIIGVGQLGSRHLQGLSQLPVDSEIDVIDPSSASLEVARQRFEEMPGNKAVHCVRYHSEITSLPKQLDYVVISTSADVRLICLERLLQHSAVKLLLLEKVLFQRIEDYAKADELIRRFGVKAWVNCPRVAYPIYSEIFEFFNGEKLIYAQAIGGDWGLGCNGIHFIDLFRAISGQQLQSLDTEYLDKKVISSKRKGFIEFTGTLRGIYSSGMNVEITSLQDSLARLFITLRSENRTCIVDETAGVGFFMDAINGAQWDRKDFRAPYLSELITSLVGELLQKETSSLPTFEESAKYHLVFIKTLANFASKFHDGNKNTCLIT
jgi:hypothetical protein